MENYPKESGDNRNPKSNNRGRSTAPPSLEIEVEVEGAKASIEDEEAQC